MVAAIDRRRMLEGSPQTMRSVDDTLVGFGVHSDLTYKTLYESTDRERASYVQFVRQAAPTAKASRLVDLKTYVQARDAEKAALAAQPPQPPLDAVGPQDGPSDADLLAAAMEVDPCRDAPSAVPPFSLSQPPERPLQDNTCGERSGPGAQLLPRGWRLTLPEEQHDWVGWALFRRAPNGQGVLTSELRLWWHPPRCPAPLHPATRHSPPLFPESLFPVGALQDVGVPPPLPHRRLWGQACGSWPLQDGEEGLGQELLVLHGHGVPGMQLLSQEDAGMVAGHLGTAGHGPS
ncbi:uncharacterized protein LOC127360984 isoform X3 [Dicentrarchus labrax]|uniref:uncharacterized protein LOC127360984 isoform X3 n=1 Tax=Dicentrarchus labrax TaxID=13489 RepID=UPI0021F5CB23|nr:uncharacterized protein LOC127360984 isoform X3 [Dicentrarchus labrax]XP_051251510.1 uncharacterized protein LOC127360984 isoform X4 [Dicentrarchus labrax]XP_051251512.1 uncharacterized protein LOC127360984 isoform X3 [Dicentrarchus labrax]